jgi:hypothetical protein
MIIIIIIIESSSSFGAQVYLPIKPLVATVVAVSP